MANVNFGVEELADFCGPGWPHCTRCHRSVVVDITARDTESLDVRPFTSTLPIDAGPRDRVSTVRTQLTTCQGILGTVAMLNQMLSVSAVVIWGANPV